MSIPLKTMVPVSDSLHNANPPNIEFKRQYRKIAIFFFIIIILSFQAAAIFGGDESRFWDGWYVAQLKDDTSEADVGDRLSDLGISGWVGRSSVEVSYNTLPGIARIPLEKLDEVLKPGDPRRDTWMASLGSLFRGSDGSSLIYLPADRSIKFYEKQIPGIELLDREKIGGILPAAIYTAAVALLLLLNRKKISHLKQRALFSLVWLPVLVFSPAVLLPFVLAAAAAGLLRGSQDARYTGILHTSVVLLASVPILAAAGSTALVAAAVPALLLTLAGALLPLGSGAEATAEMEKPAARREKKPTRAKKNRHHLSFRKREHHLFEPVSLIVKTAPVRQSRTIAPGYFRELIITAAAVFVIALVFIVQSLMPAASSAMKVPAAASSDSGFTGLSDIYRLQESHNAGSLPDISTLMASEVYQQGFMFGSSFRIPMPGENLEMTDYLAEDGRLHEETRTITSYDQQWFDRTMAEIGSGSVGALLLSAGGPSPVRMTPVRTAPIASAFGLRLYWYLAAALIILAAASAIIPRRSSVSGRSYTSLSVRRRAQAA